MDKKKLLIWSLYDFANSIIYINFLLYFAQWLVIDGGLSDFWFNAVFAIASILLLFSAPTLASYTDKYGGRKYLLNFSTIGTFLGYGLAVVFAYLGKQYVLPATILFLIGQYFYQLSFVFYNSFLENISNVEYRTRASGFGQFASGLGQVFGLVFALLFTSSRLAPLFPSIIIFLVLSLPTMIYLKDSTNNNKENRLIKLREETNFYFKKAKQFFLVSAATPILLSFFFFNDALITISNNYPIYMDRVFMFSDKTKSILLMLILLMSAIGGIVFGWIGDKIGNLKTLKIILLGWIILLPLIGITSNSIILFILTGLVGLFINSVWTVSRSYLTSILPKEEINYGFSFYTLAERFATFVGPITWGGIIGIFGPEPIAYRIAFLSMTIYVIVGLIILHYWRKHIQRFDIVQL